MTYRDDHDAALARVDRLEGELARAEDERDRLQSRVVELEHAPRRDMPLDGAELDRLVAALHGGVEGSRIKNGLAAIVGFVMFSVVIVVAIAIGAVVTGLILVAVMVFALIMRVAASTNYDPGRWQPVIDALRDAPERILSIEQFHAQRGWGTSLTIRTADHALQMNTSRSTELVALLARRCPGATFKGT